VAEAVSKNGSTNSHIPSLKSQLSLVAVAAVGSAVLLLAVVEFFGLGFGLRPPFPCHRLFTLLAGALFGGGTAFSIIHEQIRRSRAVRATAAKLGFEYVGRADEDVRRRLKTLFGDDDSVSMRDVLRKKTDKAEILAGEFSYSTGGDAERGSRDISQTAALVESQRLRLPPFRLQPAGRVVSFLLNTMGMEDMDFETHPAFSRRIHLASSEEEWTRALFDESVLEYFVVYPGLAVEAEGDRFLAYRHGKTHTPRGLVTFLEQALELSALLHEASRKAERFGGRESNPDA
jgi:hypothetical protein